MQIDYVGGGQSVVSIKLEANDIPLIVRYPQNIVCFQGDVDNKMTFFRPEMKPKAEWCKTKIKGESLLYLTSNNNAKIKLLSLEGGQSIVLDLNVLFYTENIEKKLKIESRLSAMLVANKYYKITYGVQSGNKGMLGYYGQGEVVEVTLDAGNYLYVSVANVIGHSVGIAYEFRTYGDKWSASRMPLQYKFTGPGRVLFQTNNMVQLMEDIQQKTGLVDFFVDPKGSALKKILGQ